MAILVDTNVIIDVLIQDPVWSAWSEQALQEAADAETLAINPLIYAEVSVAFASIHDLDAALLPHAFDRLPLPFEAGFLAGKAFARYRSSGGVRPSLMPDFYIGAHAAISRLALLTRNPRRYTRYFPTVRIIAP